MSVKSPWFFKVEFQLSLMSVCAENFGFDEVPDASGTFYHVL